MLPNYQARSPFVLKHTTSKECEMIILHHSNVANSSTTRSCPFKNVWEKSLFDRNYTGKVK